MFSTKPPPAQSSIDRAATNPLTQVILHATSAVVNQTCKAVICSLRQRRSLGRRLLCSVMGAAAQCPQAIDETTAAGPRFNLFSLFPSSLFWQRAFQEPCELRRAENCWGHSSARRCLPATLLWCWYMFVCSCAWSAQTPGRGPWSKAKSWSSFHPQIHRRIPSDSIPSVVYKISSCGNAGVWQDIPRRPIVTIVLMTSRSVLSMRRMATTKTRWDRLPFWLAVQACWGVQVDHLIVFHGQVVPCLLQVSHLHKVASGQSLADVGVVVPRVEVCAVQLQAHSCSDSHLHHRSESERQSWRNSLCDKMSPSSKDDILWTCCVAQFTSWNEIVITSLECAHHVQWCSLCYMVSTGHWQCLQRCDPGYNNSCSSHNTARFSGNGHIHDQTSHVYTCWNGSANRRFQCSPIDSWLSLQLWGTGDLGNGHNTSLTPHYFAWTRGKRSKESSGHLQLQDFSSQSIFLWSSVLCWSFQNSQQNVGWLSSN